MAKMEKVERDFGSGMISPLEKYKALVGLLALQYEMDCHGERAAEDKPDGMVELGLRFAAETGGNVVGGEIESV